MSDQTGERLRADALAIYGAAVQAADPATAVSAALASVRDQGAGCGFDLARQGLGVLAFGKGSASMTRGALELFGASDQTAERAVLAGGIIVGPAAAARGEARSSDRVFGAKDLEVMAGGHPLPDRSSLASAEAVLRWVRSRAWQRLLVLVSGGGSALLCAPAAGLTFADKLDATRLVMTAGASIEQLNTVRKHLSRIKGGELARGVDGRPVLVLVLSDVVGDDLATVASGPLVADPTTFAQALEVVTTLGLGLEVAEAVRCRLETGARGALAETPKPGDRCFGSIEHRIVASNSTSVAAAARCAERLGYRTERLELPIVGGAREAGRMLAARAAGPPATTPGGRGRALIAGGETTVKVSGGGLGGRNQELALAFALERSSQQPARDRGDGPGSRDGLRALERAPWVFLSAGTDGVDGPTDAAGAIVDGGTCERARWSSIDPERRLADNDSYSVLDASSDLLRTGPSGTNVADVQVFLVADE